MHFAHIQDLDTQVDLLVARQAHFVIVVTTVEPVAECNLVMVVQLLAAVLAENHVLTVPVVVDLARSEVDIVLAVVHWFENFSVQVVLEVN